MVDEYELCDTVFFRGMSVAVLRYTAFLIWAYDHEKIEKLRQERAADKALGYTFAQAEQFYDECVKSKITDLPRDADRQRLHLFAESKPEWKRSPP